MSETRDLRRLRIDDVAPDLRRATRRMPAVPAHMFGIRLMRSLLPLVPAAKLTGVTVVDHEIDGVKLRVYQPAQVRSRGALLWVHGGGLVLGDLSQDDTRCAEAARHHGVAVVSTNYRLAPEHRFPAAIDDCYAAWLWMQAHADELGIDAHGIVVGGQSAGGGLAAALVQRVHDSAGPQPLAQWLFCPMLDDRTATSRVLDPVKHFVWNNRANRLGWGSYLGDAFGANELPDYAAPARRTDLAGLPKAWVGTGDIELFFAEDRDYAERLHAAGVDVTLDVVEGGPHAFESIGRDSATALQYLDRSNAWLAAKFDQLHS